VKNCTGCKYAEWEKTKANRLHPSGSGRCMYKYKIPQLPASMYWTHDTGPRPYGGFINRNVDNDTHCVYYTEEK